MQERAALSLDWRGGTCGKRLFLGADSLTLLIKKTIICQDRLGTSTAKSCVETKRGVPFFECFPFVCPEPVLVKCSYIYIYSKKDRFSSCAGFRLPGWAARQSGAGNAKLVALKGLFGCHYLIIMKTIIPPRQARETGIGQSRTKRGVSPGCLRAARGGWRRRHGEHNRRCDRYFFGVFFPSVCPEPVLVN